MKMLRREFRVDKYSVDITCTGRYPHYISKDSVVYANAVVSEIIEAVEHLQEYPEHGLVIPDYDGVTRELIVDNYRVIYDYNQPKIHILSVIHTARLFPNF